MPTNFPSGLDTNTELGGPFINVAPVTDHARQIDATFRNNTNDAIFAIEAKLGITNSTDTSSIAWALMSVGGSYNQGLRFAGANSQWPGDTSEAGIFLDSATGQPAYHKAGDPVGTFTVIGGGTPTWNDIYAAVAGSYLDIDTADKPFYLRQSGSSPVDGSSLRLERTYRSTTTAYDDAVLLVQSNFNLSGTDSAPSLYVKHDAHSSSINNFAAVVEVGNYSNTSVLLLKSNAITGSGRYFLKCYDGNYAQDRLLFKQNGTLYINTSPNTSATDGVSISFRDTSGNASLTALRVNNASSSPTIAWFEDHSTDRFKFLSVGTLEITSDLDAAGIVYTGNVDNSGTSYSGITADMVRTDPSILDRNVWGVESICYANPSDLAPTLAIFGSYKATMSGTAPGGFTNVIYTGYYSDDTLTAGTWIESTGVFNVNTASSLFGASLVVADKDTTLNGSIFQCQDGDLLGGSSTNRVDIKRNGQSVFTGNVDGSYESHIIIENNWTTYGNTGIVLDARSNDGTTVTSLLRIFNDGHSYFSTHSNSVTEAPVQIEQLNTTESFIKFIGTEGADQTSSISTIQGDGSNVVGPYDKTTSVGWVFFKMIKVNLGASGQGYLCVYQPAL